jgi:RNA polymerase sigma factor (sigma-70 family)
VNEREATALVTALFENWYMFLVRYALRSTANYELAEDLAQETFCELYRSLRAGKTIAYPKAWTLCVLRRDMNRRIRELAHYEPLGEMEFEGGPVPEVSIEHDIRNLFSVLTPREEEVLLLRLETLKYREIAAHLGISMNSVNTLLARALKKLQQAANNQTDKERLRGHESEITHTPIR